MFIFQPFSWEQRSICKNVEMWKGPQKLPAQKLAGKQPRGEELWSTVQLMSFQRNWNCFCLLHHPGFLWEWGSLPWWTNPVPLFLFHFPYCHVQNCARSDRHIKCAHSTRTITDEKRVFQFIIKPQVSMAFHLWEQFSKLLKQFKLMFEKSVFPSPPTLGIEKWDWMSRNKCNVLLVLIATIENLKDSSTIPWTCQGILCGAQVDPQTANLRITGLSIAWLLLSMSSDVPDLCGWVVLHWCPVWRVVPLPAFTLWGL